MESSVNLGKADVDKIILDDSFTHYGISGICASNDGIIEKCTNKARLEINNIRNGENIYDRTGILNFEF